MDRWTSIATSNSTNINFTPSNNCYSYPNFRVVIQDCINTESPVINYMSLNGNIELYNTRSRIITNDNTMVFGSSNNKITMSNGNLLISSNLYQYGQSFFHDIVTINSNLNPRSNQLYDIGNENMRWNNIFLSSNGININDLVLNKDSSGALAVLSAVTNIPQRIVVDEILLGNQHDAVNSNVYLLTASSNGLGITPQNNVTSQNYIQFNDLYLTPINIGIGTSNPQESFDISYGNLLARNNAYVLSNFGLGTLSPSEKMDIRGGNVKISSNLYVLDNLGIGTSNISETFVLGNGNAKIASNLYVLENIGIGLSNPSENLEVINNTKIDNNCYIQGYTSIGPGFSNPTESLDVIDNVKVGKNLYVLNSIGVGTSNPLVNSPGLHVECDIRADSNIYGFSNLIIANNASFGDYIIRTFPRILNVTNLAYQNICVIGVTSSNDNPYFNNTYYVDWTLTQGQTSNYIVKTYSFAITGNQTSNNYLRVLPNYNGGLTQCNDFDLEVLTTPSNTTSFRLVRTSTSSSCSSNNITCLLKLTRPDLSFLQVNDDLNSNLSAVNKGTFTGNMLTLNQRTGNVGIYSSNPQVTFEINGTDAILIPSGTLLQRPNIPVTGHVRYNTSTSQFEGFGPANSWGSLGGVKSVDQLTYIAAENFPGSGDA